MNLKDVTGGVRQGRTYRLTYEVVRFLSPFGDPIVTCHSSKKDAMQTYRIAKKSGNYSDVYVEKVKSDEE